MENQHRLIQGYRELNEFEIEKVNKIKQTGLELAELIQDMIDENGGLDQRWVAVGRTHLQEGLMALTRAVTKPGGF